MTGQLRRVRFLQSDEDRRQIFAVSTGEGAALGFGPLSMDEIYAERYESPTPLPWFPPGDEALAATLTARAGDFHDLADYYRFYGYPPEVISWIEATELVNPEALGPYHERGRTEAEVVERLGLDRERVHDAAMIEALMPGAYDAEGEPMYHHGFTSNWAVGDPSGRVSINPGAYRFKAWLSLEY